MDTANTFNLIRYLKDKHTFEDTLISALVKNFHAQNLHKHSILLNTGERWSKVFFIDKGLLRLFYNTASGKEFNKGFFSNNSLIWPMAPSAQKYDSLFSISCIEDTRVLSMSFTEFRTILTQHNIWPEFALPYVENLADQKFIREHQLLVHNAKDRYLHIKEELSDIFHQLPDYHIASYMGITHVALSRVKSQIKQEESAH